MLRILYAEYDATHRGDFIFDIPEGQDSWLLLMTHTPAVFRIEDQLRVLPPNTVMLYRPHQRIYYRAHEERYGNDWIRFETDELFFTETALPCGVPLRIEDSFYLHKLFQIVAIEHAEEGEYRDIVLGKLLQVMFHKLLESNVPPSSSPLFRDVHDLRLEIHARPELDWSLGQIAARLNISTGYLEQLYKNNFGIGCIEDVIASRIRRAQHYLVETTLAVAEIIPRCGYRTAEHFYRQFKKHTGLTPLQYRAAHADTN